MRNVVFLLVFTSVSAKFSFSSAQLLGTDAHSSQGSCGYHGAGDLCALGDALLQTRRLNSKVLPPLEATDDNAGLQPGFDLTAEDTNTRQRVNGFNLTEESFSSMASECCLLSFDLYTRRLLVESLGMEICDEGCHNGFMPFFTCGKSTLQNYIDHIQQKSLKLCACYKPAGQCNLGGLPQKCYQENTGKYVASAHRRRTCADPMATTTGGATVAGTTMRRMMSTSTITTTTTTTTTTITTTTTTTITITTTASTTTITTITVGAKTVTARAGAKVDIAGPSTNTITTTTTSITTTTSTSTITSITSTTTTSTTTTQHELLQGCDPSLLSQAGDMCNKAMQLIPKALEVWLTSCLVEICNSDPDQATTISQKYNVTGDPLTDCSEDTKAYAKNSCFKELNASCDATKDWVEACVQDVCAAAKAGDVDPFGVAHDYCGPQELLGEVWNEQPSTTLTTTGFQDRNTTMWELCDGGPTRFYKESPTTGEFPECAMDVSLEQCQWYYDNHHGSGNGSLSVRVGGWNDKYPHGCFYAGGKPWSDSKQGEQYMGWNIGKGGSKKNYNSGYRLCCGAQQLKSTTTTTTPLGIVLPEPPSDKPPLRPYKSSMPVDLIDRPADAKFGTCLIWGDPHFIGFDMRDPLKKLDHFGFGNFWIVRSSAVWIQGHYSSANSRRPSITYLRKVAIGGPFLEGNTMMIETSNIWWNDDDHILTLSSVVPSTWTGMDGAVTARSVATSDGKKVQLSLAFPHQVSLKIKITLQPGGVKIPWLTMVVGMEQITGQDGHCGNFNGVREDDSQLLLDQSQPVDASELLIPY